VTIDWTVPVFLDDGSSHRLHFELFFCLLSPKSVLFERRKKVLVSQILVLQGHDSKLFEYIVEQKDAEVERP
jgi:hypothetical protein